MTSIEQSILEALKEMDAAVKTAPANGPRPNLLPLFARIDELARQLPPGTEHDLLHYLHRKSYEKARAKLEGHAAARGSCEK